MIPEIGTTADFKRAVMQELPDRIVHARGIRRMVYRFIRAVNIRRLKQGNHRPGCPCRYAHVNFKFPFVHYPRLHQDVCFCNILIMFQKLDNEITEMLHASRNRQ